MIRNSLIMGALMLLTACAHDPDARLKLLEAGSSEPQAIPSVRCSGFLQWTDCNTLAERQCDSGYQVIKREEDWVSQRRELYFRCK